MSAAAGFVGKRMAMLSTCASREKLARLYAAVSVAIAAVGRANAGWVDGIDPKLKTDAGRGVSDANAHYQWVAGGANLDAPGEFVGQRMTALSTTVPRNVYAKVYSDVSVLIARCGTTGQCGQ